MKEIILSKGKYAIVDNKDYENLKGIKWSCSYYGYAVGMVKGKMISMARLILDAPKGVFVDHINHNTLDNRRENLRLCTQQQNNFNKTQLKGTSKYKGVSWSKYHLKWAGYIKIDGKRKFLGYFNNEIEPAKIYDKEAKQLFGQYAKLNFV